MRYSENSSKIEIYSNKHINQKKKKYFKETTNVCLKELKKGQS